ncbi:MAG: hypothetical protein LBO74_08515 [Candidatus Symbiothrix sp.]|jgi:hypothetical protein|nr:hypothetical protein [Candidatus Symbiothrix sp.]
MAVLAWGGMNIEFAPLTAGTPGTYTALDKKPVLDSFNLDSDDGDELKAQYEGGDIADYKRLANQPYIEFDRFVEKGTAKPIPDNDGVVTSEYAIRVIPEDTTLEGRQMPRCTVSVKELWKSADGIKLHYTFRGMKPATGNVLQPYTAPQA